MYDREAKQIEPKLREISFFTWLTAMPKDLRFTSLQSFRLLATPACFKRHLITFNSYMVLEELHGY